MLPSPGGSHVGCIEGLEGRMIPRFGESRFCIGTGYTGGKFRRSLGGRSWMKMWANIYRFQKVYCYISEKYGLCGIDIREGCVALQCRKCTSILFGNGRYGVPIELSKLG